MFISSLGLYISVPSSLNGKKGSNACIKRGSKGERSLGDEFQGPTVILKASESELFSLSRLKKQTLIIKERKHI